MDPLLVEKYRPEAILGFSETGHTYVLCDGKRSSAWAASARPARTSA